jgi:hypothetical protein
MRKFAAAALALTTAASLLAAAPAEARWGGGYGHWHHGGYGGDALVAGLAGLAVGAAIAGSSRPHYYPGPRYYYGPPPGYYAPRCWTEGRWDPYWGRYVPVRVCG